MKKLTTLLEQILTRIDTHALRNSSSQGTFSPKETSAKLFSQEDPINIDKFIEKLA